jgi:hypothetical protein
MGVISVVDFSLADRKVAFSKGQKFPREKRIRESLGSLVFSGWI